MPVVKISARLKLDENISFLDGHQLNRPMGVIPANAGHVVKRQRYPDADWMPESKMPELRYLVAGDVKEAFRGWERGYLLTCTSTEIVGAPYYPAFNPHSARRSRVDS